MDARALLLILILAACGGEEPAADAGVEAAAAVPAPLPVEVSRVAYATVGETAVSGLLARPAGAAAGTPAVVVVHDAWGLGDQVEATARQLAERGYVVLAVDLFGGQTADRVERARQLLGQALSRPAAIEDNLRQACAWLRSADGSLPLGVLGFSLGGDYALRLAASLGDQLGAVAVFYGRPPEDPAAVAAIEAPLLGLFGGTDRGIPRDRVRAFEQALTAAGKAVQVVFYDQAGHGFANPAAARYDAAVAADALGRAAAFFDHALGR